MQLIGIVVCTYMFMYYNYVHVPCRVYPTPPQIKATYNYGTKQPDSTVM